MFFLFFACEKKTEQNIWLITAPADTQSTYANIKDKSGISITPHGCFLTPRGKQITTAPHPYGLVLSNDNSIAITANSGTSPLSITIIKDVLSENPTVQQIPPSYDTDKGVLASVFMGLAISPNNQYVYVAGGQDNKIYIFNISDGSPAGSIDCSVSTNNQNYSHGYLGDLVLTADGSTIYCVDQINFLVNIIDVKSRKIISRVNVGRYPFGISLSPDEKNIYVANVGVFSYKVFPSVDKNRLKETTLPFPAFAYNTKESRDGYKNDTVEVPGLGDPNVPESFSVWAVDVSDKSNPKVTAKIKTGFLVGQKVEGFPAVGGSSPNSVVSSDKYVFVSNGNNDCISVIEVKNNKIIKEISLAVDERLKKYRGIIPFGLALSPDMKRLYVAESGLNAVGVIDVQQLKVIGHIPVGWFPSKLKVSNDGKKLIVANAKGVGSGPNGGKNWQPGPEGYNIGKLMKGMVSVLDIPKDDQLKNETQQVINNNFKFSKLSNDIINQRKNHPIPLYPGEKESPIKYIVFISKENRTYDEVFGQLKNGKGDASLARFGYNAEISDKNQSSKFTSDVMINHLKLSETFAISDNFYVNSDHSADGHRWLACTYPNQWVETSVSASYGRNRTLRIDSKAPGALAMVGSGGAIYPEDYNEAGSIWDHLDRYNIDFFNFGFSIEHSPHYDDSTFKYTGIQYMINFPLPTPLFKKTSRTYATYNMAIPDQFRADMFIKEFKEKWLGKGKTMPSVLTILLPNDHGAEERPHAGYPFLESYMADNDLALGRIIEFLSNTPYWKNMAIFITEDDSQSGVDHIDAHRSLLMIISPYAKRNYVSHKHTSFGSIFKTFWNILGIPYLNLYDATATDLSDFFQDKPDFTPYKKHMVDKRIFDPQKALDPFDEKFDFNAINSSPALDDPNYMIKQSEDYKKRYASKSSKNK